LSKNHGEQRFFMENSYRVVSGGNVFHGRKGEALLPRPRDPKPPRARTLSERFERPTTAKPPSGPRRSSYGEGNTSVRTERWRYIRYEVHHRVFRRKKAQTDRKSGARRTIYFAANQHLHRLG